MGLLTKVDVKIDQQIHLEVQVPRPATLVDDDQYSTQASSTLVFNAAETAGAVVEENLTSLDWRQRAGPGPPAREVATCRIHAMAHRIIHPWTVGAVRRNGAP